jgi:1-acyl-sn-glycerol-3-phosphate acyltransferase
MGLGLDGGAQRNGHAPAPYPEREPHAPHASERPSLLTHTLNELADQVSARLSRGELRDRDPDFIRERLPLVWLIATLWFRAEVRGLGNVPDEGPVLLVGNHSGGSVTPDTAVFALAFSTYFGVERPFYQLVRNPVAAAPPLRWGRRFGAVTASDDNARDALRAGAALLVYPGGDHEAHRPTTQRNRVDFGGRTELLRLALDENVPVVPVVAIGGHETALFLARGDRLARRLALDRLLRLKALPISLALPWGLNVGDLVGHIPLPAKITIETLPAIDLRAEFGEAPDVRDVYDHVVRTMQDALDALAAERRLPVLG